MPVGNQLAEVGIVGVIFAEIVLTVSVAGSFRIAYESFQFQFLLGVHHLHASASACGHAHVHAVIDDGRSRMAALRGDFYHAVGSLHAVEGACGGILEHFHALDVGWVQVVERLGRNHLSVHHIERFVGGVALAE